MEATRTGPIRIDFKSEESVLVISDDEDRFLMTSRDAALACKQGEHLLEWQSQFNPFLLFLRKWCEAHSEQVRTGYLTIGDSSLNVLIFIFKEDYDFEFEDALVELDAALAEKFPRCSAEVLQIPKQKPLTSELPHEALFFYGDSTGSSETSRTQ